MRLPQVADGGLQFWRDRAQRTSCWSFHPVREASAPLVDKNTPPFAHGPHGTVPFRGNLAIRSSSGRLLPDRDSLLIGRFLSNLVHDVSSSRAIHASGEHHTMQLND